MALHNLTSPPPTQPASQIENNSMKQADAATKLGSKEWSMARKDNPTTVMPATSAFGTVRATRSCNAVQINSAIAAQVSKEVGTGQEMMMSLS